MKIINPIYDKAFKYLMENNRLARKVLSVILDTEVLEVELSQQETTWPREGRGLTMFRLDFKAIIREADGEKKTVLIELQKSKFVTDIIRFRNYLASSYMSKHESSRPNDVSGSQKPAESDKPIASDKPAEYASIYPIITIYILGYTLDDLPYMAVTVNRDVINSVSKEKLHVKSFFIEHLTHQSHIIQVRRLPEKRRSRLEKFLTLFNQAWCTREPFVLDLQDVPREFMDVARHLQKPLLDDNFRRYLEAEEELDTIFDHQELKYQKLLAEERKKQEEYRVQKEEEHRQKHVLATKLAKFLKEAGADTETIAKETGLSAEEL